MKPQIFVSSTYYDLKYAREEIKKFLENYGFDPTLFENGKIIYQHGKEIDKSVYEELSSCDIMILIVEGRYGSSASQKKEKNEHEKTNETYTSITRKEFETAIGLKIPILVFIAQNVHTEYSTYRKNSEKDLEYTQVDNVLVYKFIDFIKKIEPELFIKTFNKVEDIKIHLTEQFAGWLRLYINSLKKPTEYKEEKLNRDRYKQIIENAPDNTDVCFISITAKNDLSNLEDNDHFDSASRRGVGFKGIVFNPEGTEAKFRAAIESKGKDLKDTLLYNDAENVLFSLNQPFWKNKNIEIKYARVGLQFKLWLSEKEAIIEPYHFGQKSDSETEGMCGFNRMLYDKNSPEYFILKSHFNRLWTRSDPFWPKSNNSLFSRVEIEINTNCNKEDFCFCCPNKNISPINPPKFMDDKLYKKIINELSALDFSGRISFHFYGEPLAHPNIGKIIQYASKKLPKAERVIYTNGDELNELKYRELISAGISKIIISNIQKKNFPPRENQIVLNNIHLNNKGGSVGTIETLYIPCYAPTHRLVIAYNGDALLCYEDVKRENIFGNVNDTKIIDIWRSTKFQSIRENIANGKRILYSPCKICDNQSHTKRGQAYVNIFE